MAAPPKYPKTPHLPWSPNHRSNDDKIIDSLDSILQDEVVITEKLDGGCTALYDGEIYARSVAAPAQHPWMGMVKKHHGWKTMGRTDMCIYGEDLFGVHSIKYGPIPEDMTYRPFAVLFMSRMEFASFDEMCDIADSLGMAPVPVLYRGFPSEEELENITYSLHRSGSELGGPREGIVARAAGPYPFSQFASHTAKSVRLGHVQTTSHWAQNWEPCDLLPPAAA